MRLLWLGLVIPILACSERRDVQLGPGQSPDAVSWVGCALAAPAAPRCGAMGDRPDGGVVGDGPSRAVQVTDRVDLPTSATLARDFGCDLDESGTPDNQLANVLAALKGWLDVRAPEDEAVRAGEILLVLSQGAGSLEATLAVPAGPAGPSASWSGRELRAACGSATLAASSEEAGRFDGDRLTVPLALVPGQHATPLDLTHVRVTLDGRGGAKICGAIELCQLVERFLPALVTYLERRIAGGGEAARDDCLLFDVHARCAPNPDHCAAFGAGRGPPPGCLRAEDVLESPITRAVLKPDVTLGGVPRMSVGLSVTLVEARQQP